MHVGVSGAEPRVEAALGSDQPVQVALPAQVPVSARPTSLVGRATWLLGEITAVVAVGALAAVLTGAPLWAALSALALLVTVNYYDGQQRLRPGLPHLGQVVRDMGVPFMGVLLVGATELLPPVTPWALAAVIGTATTVVLAAALLRRRLAGPLRIAVVGDQLAVGLVAAHWAKDRRVQVVGALLHGPDEDDSGSPYLESIGVPTVRGTNEAAECVDRWAADLVVAAPGPGLGPEDVRALGWRLEGTRAGLAVTGLFDLVSPHRLTSTALGGRTFLQLGSSRAPLVVRAAKAAADRLVGLVLLLLASPLLAALVVAVRLDSRGPGFYRQVRVGRDGREFTMVKLRSMSQDSDRRRGALEDLDEGAGLLFKMKDDPRITRVGRFLRKTSLDELPQLVNVVRGDMSLIGPRPALPAEVAQYDDTVRRRLAVRPGITGLWQVSGRSDLDWDESVSLDLRYTDNVRLTDDLAIALRTVKAVTQGSGAY